MSHQIVQLSFYSPVYLSVHLSIYLVVLLEFEPWAFYVLDKCRVTKIHPPVFNTRARTRTCILQPENTVWLRSGLKTKGCAALQRETSLGALPWIKSCFAFLSLVTLTMKFVSRVVRTDSRPLCGKCRYSHAWSQIYHNDVWHVLCLWCSREDWSLGFSLISRVQPDTGHDGTWSTDTTPLWLSAEW